MKSHWHWHPAVRTGDDLTRSERGAELAIKFLGSLLYIALQTAVTTGWITLNLVAFVYHWDPYPFILLNLMFSVQAAYAAPIILLGQRRSDQRNSERAQYDLETDRETLSIVKDIRQDFRDYLKGKAIRDNYAIQVRQAPGAARSGEALVSPLPEPGNAADNP